MILSRRPLVSISSAFALGILVSGSLVVLSALTLAAAGSAVVMARTGRRTWTAAAILLAFCAVGGWRAALARMPAPDDIVHFTGPQMVTLFGTVAGDVEGTRDAWMCELTVGDVSVAGGRRIACSGRVVGRLRRDGSSPTPDVGDTIEARGRLELPNPATNPGGFDYAAYLAERGIFTVFSTHRAGAWHLARTSATAGSLLSRSASWCRQSLRDTLGRLLPQAEAGVLSGILIGARNALPPQIDDDFAATGTAHILATAGLHVGLVAGLLFAGFRICRLGRKTACALTILVLVFYALVAGMRPSVVRAVLMTDIFLIGILFDRESDAPVALAAAALLLLAVRPGYLFDAGFELSFATVGTIMAILAVTQPMLARLRPIPAANESRSHRMASSLLYGISSFLVLTFAAQIGSAPLVAQYFNQVSVIGIAANLLIVPVLLCLIVAGFGAWFASFVWPVGAYWIAAGLLSPLLAYIVGAARVCVRVPGGVVYVPSPGWFLIASYYVAVAFGIILLRARQVRHDDRRTMAVQQDAKAEVSTA